MTPAPMPANEQKRLAVLARAGDRAARAALALANTPFVWSAAKRIWRRCPATPIEDFVQEGMIGLLQAIDKFDPTRGNGFLTYASWWVNAALQRRAGTDAPAMSCGTNIGQFGQRMVHEYEVTLGLGVEDEEARAYVAAKHRTSVARVSDILAAFMAHNVEFENERRYARTADIDMERTLDRRRLGHDVRSAIRRMKLTPRDRDIVQTRLMQDAEDGPDTLQMISDRWSISRERVRQLESHLRRRLTTVLRTIHERENEHGSSKASFRTPRTGRGGLGTARLPVARAQSDGHAALR